MLPNFLLKKSKNFGLKNFLDKRIQNFFVQKKIIFAKKSKKKIVKFRMNDSDDFVSYAKSIPLDTFLSYPMRNVKNAPSFAVDIGGSLTKLAYYSTVKFKINKDAVF